MQSSTAYYLISKSCLVEICSGRAKQCQRPFKHTSVCVLESEIQARCSDRPIWPHLGVVHYLRFPSGNHTKENTRASSQEVGHLEKMKSTLNNWHNAKINISKSTEVCCTAYIQEKMTTFQILHEGVCATFFYPVSNLCLIISLPPHGSNWGKGQSERKTWRAATTL